jgi:hypothetical protein
MSGFEPSVLRLQLSQPANHLNLTDIEMVSDIIFRKWLIVLMKENQKDEHEMFLFLPCKGPVHEKPEVL